MADENKQILSDDVRKLAEESSVIINSLVQRLTTGLRTIVLTQVESAFKIAQTSTAAELVDARKLNLLDQGAKPPADANANPNPKSDPVANGDGAKTCSKPSCNRPARSKGLCSPHYQQQRRAAKVKVAKKYIVTPSVSKRAKSKQAAQK